MNSDRGLNEENPGYSESEILKERFLQLHKVQQLQKSILKQNMHNAMSPLSAISGYLELIDMTLNMDSDVSQLQYYRKKIERGVLEVNEILVQLQEVYKENEEFDDEPEDVEVDINWLVEDVYRDMKINKSRCLIKLHSIPIHITAHIYSIKLILFKLISYAVKSIHSSNKVIVAINEAKKNAAVSVSFKVSDIKKQEIKEVINSALSIPSNFSIYQNSLNEGLAVSLQLIKHMKGEIFFKEGDNQLVSFILTYPKS